jgi:hypothetical protein
MCSAAALVAAVGLSSAMAVGPDVIVGDLHQVQRWGTSNGQQAYSVGTVSCNIGDVNLRWIASTNQHPVIGQNLFRYKDGRFEQLGQSWLKHGFFALSESLCSRCNPTDGTTLGVGCSDPYSSGLNGSQNSLGPRYQVNAFTGHFPYPVTGVPNATGQMRRLLVNNADVDPALNSGARYFVEGQYVTPDDAAAGNGGNNASYREVRFTGSGSSFPISFVSGQTTRRMQNGLRAWKICDPDVTIREVRVPDEGTFWVGFRVTQSNGLYTYEYAIQNLNSDRSGGAVRMDIPGCDHVSNQGWKGVDYHSGEIWSNAPWITEKVGNQLVWRSPQTYAENTNTNALRWGTLYNFRFQSTLPPREGNVTLDLFKPGAIGSVSFLGLVPRAKADFNNDGVVDFFDYDAYVEAFESGGSGTDTNGDGFVDFFDYNDFVQVYELGC